MGNGSARVNLWLLASEIAGVFVVIGLALFLAAGTVAWAAGWVFVLGSWLGLRAGLVLAVAIAFRAVREEDTLRAELPGYADYRARVRYRLIPRIW